MKNILVTGANGLLGRHIIKRLVHDDFKVFSLVRNEPESCVDGVDYIKVNLGGDWSCNLLPTHIDSIIHLAQSDKFREFPEQALDVFQVNIASTAKLLDYAAKVKCKNFIYASSGGVYGAGSSAFSENSPISPVGNLGYYLGSKLCSEILVQSYTEIMNVTALRFFFMYGPGQKRSMLIPRLVDNIKNAQPISLQGEQGISINPIHVNDAVNALMNTFTLKQSSIINIGGPQVLSLRQIGDIIGEKLGKEPQYDKVSGKPNDLIGDVSLMKELLYKPEIMLANGILDVL